MFNFQKPFCFLLLLLLPAFAGYRKIGILRTASLFLPLANWNGFEPEKETQIYVLYRISQYAAVACFIFVVAALAEPVYQISEPVYAESEQAFMFVIDTSPSMAAQDIGVQTRLEAAKNIIRLFTEQYSGDSFGLTALGSTASVLMPPTVDKQTFLSRLEQLHVGEFGEGTAIGMGLASAVLHLVQYTAIPSHIILFTDGDNNTGEVHPRVAANIIKHKKIGFHIVGIGKSGYAPVKYFDPIQKKEISGTLHTVFNEMELQKIAHYGNGRYFSVASPELLMRIFDKLTEKMPATSPAMTLQKVTYLDTFFLLIAAGLGTAAWLLYRLGIQAV